MIKAKYLTKSATFTVKYSDCVPFDLNNLQLHCAVHLSAVLQFVLLQVPALKQGCGYLFSMLWLFYVFLVGSTTLLPSRM